MPEIQTKFLTIEVVVVVPELLVLDVVMIREIDRTTSERKKQTQKTECESPRTLLKPSRWKPSEFPAAMKPHWCLGW